MSLVDQENLFKAVQNDDEKKVKYLVEEKGVPPSSLDFPEWRTPAHIAAVNGNLRIVQYLVKKDPSILVICDHYGYTILYTAIENGHVDIVKYLVENHNVHVSRRISSVNGNTPIHTAAEFGHLDILKYFVEQKDGNVNTLNNDRWPPLFLAAQNEHHDVVTYLVEQKNVSLTTMDDKRRNILYICVFNDDVELMKYVLDERKVKLDINWRDILGDTLVHRATTLNNIHTLKYLVKEKHADINLPDKWGDTPLHCAAKWNHYEICKYLLKYGADTEIRNQNGLRPVEETPHKGLVKFLERASQKRGRRSVLPGLISYTTMRSTSTPVQKSIGNRALYGSDFFHSQFCNFLLMARSIISCDRSLSREGRYLHDDGIDPVALDAIHTVPNRLGDYTEG